MNNLIESQRNFLKEKRNNMIIKRYDWILYIVCLVTLVVAGYDLLHLKQIEHKTLEKCNDHWQREFMNKCIYPGYPIVPKSENFIYNLNISSIKTEI